MTLPAKRLWRPSGSERGIELSVAGRGTHAELIDRDNLPTEVGDTRCGRAYASPCSHEIVHVDSRDGVEPADLAGSNSDLPVGAPDRVGDPTLFDAP